MSLSTSRTTSKASRRSREPGDPRSPRRWAVGGALLGALLTVLVQAPAAWLAAGVQSVTANQVLLQEPRGTLWRLGADRYGPARARWHEIDPDNYAVPLHPALIRAVNTPSAPPAE